MLARRLIPCLDVADGVVVKGVRFRDHRIVGDIVDLARRYAAEGADELVFYDITASPANRSADASSIPRRRAVRKPAHRLSPQLVVSTGSIRCAGACT